jgi:hypothetical protein
MPREEERAVTRILPDSSSIVLRATHVLVIRIEVSQVGEQSPDPSGWLRREVSLTLRLEERLKGTTREDVGSSLSLQVTQWASTSPWATRLPGVWSGQSVEPGTLLVAFCRSEGDRTAELLVEPACELLMPAEDALADARLAMRAETGRLDVETLLAEAREVAASLGHLFVEYLWEVHGDAFLWNPKAFESLMQLLEHPDLALIARATLLSQVSSRFLAGTANHANRVRLALAMFRLLEVDKAALLRDNILGTFLPNLLGLSSGAAQVKADEVFLDLPDERQRMETLVRELQPSAEALIQWL